MSVIDDYQGAVFAVLLRVKNEERKEKEVLDLAPASGTAGGGGLVNSLWLSDFNKISGTPRSLKCGTASR